PDNDAPTGTDVRDFPGTPLLPVPRTGKRGVPGKSLFLLFCKPPQAARIKGASSMSGLLTTHILDTMHGIPAADLQLQLWRPDGPGEQRTLLKVMRTNSQGRTDEPLLHDEAMLPGSYELVFAVGAYFAARQAALPEPPFLDLVPVRFGLADANAHYH